MKFLPRVYIRKRCAQWLGLVIILLLVLFALLPAQAQAKPEADAWTKYPIPQKGETGGWVLTSDVSTEGTGVTAICVAYDGTLYAATEETSGSPLNGYNLFKSTDGGYSWTPLWEIPTDDKPADGPVSDPASKIIALLMPRWEYADILYLATQYNVYKSTDGGENFTTLGVRPVYGSGANPTSSCLITSLDVTYYQGSHWLLLGSGDADADYGGVYLCDESQYLAFWTDLRVGGGGAGTKYDVLDVAFSPNFADDMQVVAVVSDETKTIVTTKLNYSDWGATIGDAVLSFPSTGGCLAFPGDYDSSDVEEKYIQYIGLNAGGASAVYLVIGYETPDSSMILPMFFPDSTRAIHSIVAAGEAYNATIVAGLTDGNVIYSDLSGARWRTAHTPPSVTATATDTYVALGGFYSSGYVVYAGTCSSDGTIRKNCGFARSVDSGDSFAQIAFICDDLQTITNLAVSPNYTNDSTIYMITEGNSGRSILWRTTNSGATWDAVLTEGQGITLASGSTVTMPKFDKVAISPRFASDTTVFIREEGNAPAIWRSTDNGFHFSPLPIECGTTGTINAWAMVNNREILVGDSLGDFYKTINSRLTWSPAVATGLSSFSSMALSPNYDYDSTILAGGDGGEVYLSTDGGETWEELADTGLVKSTVVAFDPNYAENKTVYAADYGAAGAEAGIMRYVVDTYTVGERIVVDTFAGWKRIDDTSPSRIEEIGASISPRIRGMVVAGDGNGLSTLYVTDPNPVVPRVVGTTAAGGGVARCLNPTGTLSPATEAPVFEIVNTDLTAGGELSGLWHTPGSHTLWSIDTTSTPMVLYIYEDTLTLSPKLTSPPDGACSGRETSGEVLWDAISSASSYNLWYDIAPSFKRSPVQIYCDGVKVNISGLDNGTTYYWRVRVGKAGGSTCVPGTTITYGAPTLSRFSTGWSFTTALGGAQWDPFWGPVNEQPYLGAKDVPIRPAFAWNPAEGATGYEFELSRDSEFSDMVMALTGADALSTTVWVCSQDLEYNTTYFWRVRAISATSQSQWAVGVFTTGAAPPAPPQPPQPPPQVSSSPSGAPLYLWVALGIGVILVLVVLGLIVITLRARL